MSRAGAAAAAARGAAPHTPKHPHSDPQPRTWAGTRRREPSQARTLGLRLLELLSDLKAGMGGFPLRGAPQLRARAESEPGPSGSREVGEFDAFGEEGGGDSSLLKSLGTHPPPLPEVSWARGGRDPESRVPPWGGVRGGEVRRKPEVGSRLARRRDPLQLVPFGAFSCLEPRAGRGSLLVSGGGGVVPIACGAQKWELQGSVSREAGPWKGLQRSSWCVC